MRDQFLASAKEARALAFEQRQVDPKAGNWAIWQLHKASPNAERCRRTGTGAQAPDQ